MKNRPTLSFSMSSFMINILSAIMKANLLSLIAVCLMSLQNSNAQAPNFTETDINGNTHDLYSDYLNNGVPVWMDFMATWCGPCWGLHEKGYFKEFYAKHGPNAIGDGYVFMIESDANTSVSALSDPNFDYTYGTLYPIIDDADESVPDDYGVSGYPTICLVCPDNSYYIGSNDGLYYTDIVNSEFLEDYMYEKCGNSMVPQHTLNAQMMEVSSLNTYCGGGYVPSVKIRNMGSATITSMELEVFVDGVSVSTFNWSGVLAKYEKEDIILQQINGGGANINLEVKIINVNGVTDDLVSDNTGDKFIELAYYSLAGDELNVTVHIDQMGWQCEWEILDPNYSYIGGQNWYETGNLDDPLPAPIDYTFSNLSPGCYTFHGFDATGNGLVDYSLTEWGVGADPTIYYPTEGFVLRDGNSNLMGSIQTFDYYTDVSFLVGAPSTGGYIGLIEEEIASDVSPSLYPNPANERCIIKLDGIVDYEIKLYNNQGQTVQLDKTIRSSDKIELATSKLENGLYYLEIISDDNYISSSKLVIFH